VASTQYLDQPVQLTPGPFGKHVAEHRRPAHRPMSMQTISPGQLAGRQSAEDCRDIHHDAGSPGIALFASPAQDASLRAEANRLTSPISDRITSAVNGPMPAAG